MKLNRKLPKKSDSKILYGRLAIRTDMKQLMEAEAEKWDIRTADYVAKIFEHFFCEIDPRQRFLKLKGDPLFNWDDYEPENKEETL